MKKLFLYLLVSMITLAVEAQTTKWQDIHKVKKSETIFGISRDYGITIDELLDANPEMRQPGYELKKGKTIFIPFAKQKQEEKEKVTPAPAKKSSIDVGIMLPLHDIDGDGKRMVEYYRGVLMAVEQLKNDGINVNVKAWNVPQDADIKNTLAENGAKGLDIIFGPLYTKQVKDLAAFCKNNSTKMVIPFSINGDEVDKNEMIYQIYQTPQQITDASIQRYIDLFSDCNTVIIDCNDSTSQKGIFTFGLRKQLENKNIPYSITNLNSSDEMFAKAFSLLKRNVVILNTGRSPQLTMAMKKLDILTAANKNVQISLYGYTDWLMYQKYNQNQAYFCKYDTYIPSTFYYNEEAGTTIRFVNHYKALFNANMMNALPHFAVTGYDQAMYFIGGMHKYGAAFKAERNQLYSTPLQTPFNFVKTKNGGYRNKAFQLIHFKNDNTMEMLSY